MTKQDKIIKEELQEPNYIGEDGGMVIDYRYSAQVAYQKMRQRIIDDCGAEDAEWQLEGFTEDQVGVGWLHLVTPERAKDFDNDTEWYVSIKDESKYPVWVYWG